MRQIRLILAALAFLLAAGPAAAAEPIGERLCYLHMDEDSTLGQALAQRGDCRTGDRSLAGPRVWGFAERRATGDGAETALLVGDPADIAALSLYSRAPGEGWRVQRFEPADIVENWRTGLRYAVPVDAAASEIAIAVDRPWHVDAIALFEIMSPEALAASHYRKSMLYAVFIGILTVPILYNLVFFGVTRERFMLWHVGISVGVLGYGMLSSGLVFLFLPDLPLDVRWRLNMASIALCVCSMAMFCRSFPEPGAISRFVRNGLVAATLPILLAAGLVISGAEFARPWADAFFVAAVIPPLIFVAASIGQGLMRDSRVARFQAAAWTPMLIFTTERIIRNLGIYAAPVDLHFAIYYALAFETVISAIAVADRVMAIRRQRDRAQEREKVLAALAETDELTGLPDRRGIMAAFDDEGDARAFAIIDLDHFKKVNDRHGHDAGDRVLRSVGDLLAGWSDITAGRLGGEEFVAFLHGADPEAAAERLQRAITIRIARDVPELDETVTASMGVVRIRPGQDFVSAYRASDKCLYRAKEAGRNRVVFGADLRAQPRLRRAAA